MQIKSLPLEGVLLLTPKVYKDTRGFFLESFNQQRFTTATGLNVQFVQDNHSRSAQHVLRGLHLQHPQSQGKLIHVLQGIIYDVVVDLRPNSRTFGQWLGVYLDAHHHQQLWIPNGFAHGFLVISPIADVLYKTTDYYAPHHEYTLLWDDHDLAIDWPLQQPPILSEKDKMGLSWYAIQQLLIC